MTDRAPDRAPAAAREPARRPGQSARQGLRQAPSAARGLPRLPPGDAVGAAPTPGRHDPHAPHDPPPARQGWQAAIATTVGGLGYELVDVERAPRGLLRVSIDRVPGRGYAPRHSPDDLDHGEFVTVDDCEAVTRQLQHVLEVEGLDYARLEVSSPGLDRPLRSEADYRRFAGQSVQLTLKAPLGGRKHFAGVLEAAGPDWRLVLAARAAAGAPARRKPAAASLKAASTAAAAPLQALDFTLQDVREARLQPVVDFKGRRAAGAAPAHGDGDAAAAPQTDGG